MRQTIKLSWEQEQFVKEVVFNTNRSRYATVKGIFETGLMTLLLVSEARQELIRRMKEYSPAFKEGNNSLDIKEGGHYHDKTETRK